jgi:hypothetical protein
MAPERSKKNTAKTNTVFENRMNQKLTYEQTIAGKLEVLPVPEIEAAIWKRIEFQLDIDMPTEGDADTAQPPPHFPKPGPLKLGAISIIFLTALLLFYSIRKNKDHTTPAKISPPTEIPIILPKKQDGDPPPLEKKIQASPSLIPGTTSSTIPVDSSANAQPTVLPPDSNALIKDRGDVIIIPPAATRNDSEHIPKKKKGVRGLTDEDYRIEPKKKDSLP